ncbi:hypothetical protein HG536_0F03800 [Torulaspora globosa]|uniref:non-specific serine/threonine protein kinase n=1 Tax=Torulaspora globosa TaxID=48254 RepID=A0A7G3ZKL9_9SACH|nr:uncharacterized protein HG536_0F03800 [Torulaspora globosa]QLL34055.1 hypothetical protein HG536_0F03800 [Torulaspora globosa]
MPYIGASNVSQSSFRSFKEKHSMNRSVLQVDSSAGSTVSSLIEVSDTRACSSTADTTSHSSSLEDVPPCSRGKAKHLKNEVDGTDLSRLRSRRAQSVDSIATSATEPEAAELLTLPNESTHAYSYNPLSPNSLAVRLSILKRTLEILIGNPQMLMDSNHQRNWSGVMSGRREDKQVKRTAHSAALDAFVSSTNASLTSSGVQSPAPSRGKTSLALSSHAIPSSRLERASSIAFLPEFPYRGDLQAGKDNIVYNSIGTASTSTELIDAQRTDLESLLDLLNETLENNTSAKATDLHMISLLNINKLILGNSEHNHSTSQSQLRTLHLKKTLLNSLAEPFFEHYTLPEDEINEEEIELRQEISNVLGADLKSDSQLPIESIRPQQDYGRILHTFTSGKNRAPQAIFTCSQQHPWQFKAANDLACLTFGISKTVLKALTLLDLIHTDSRNFVLNKILSTEGQELVFTGEIVAIIQPGSSDKSSDLIWASFWAKRKNDMLVCVFQKVPCDYVDVILDLRDYSVSSVSNGGGLFWNRPSEDRSEMSTISNAPKFELGFDESGDEDDDDEDSADIKIIPASILNRENKNERKIKTRKSVKFADQIQNVDQLSHSLSRLIKDVIDGKIFSEDDDLLPIPIRVANHINTTRYFTLNHLSYNIPCAVSSSMLEDKLKLKIHSLPYQAGLFVVDSQSLRLISSNKSILKNIFGFHFAELVGRPLTEIIPSFGDLIDFINVKYSALKITLARNRGLVLTEHFFRKIKAEMNNDPEGFYTSVGIDARHRDGRLIKVDFQLRVMNPSVILLWVTHSRDVVFKDYTSTPSQLHMLKDHEPAYYSSDNSSEASSKRSSSKISIDRLKDLSEHGTSRSNDVSLLGSSLRSTSLTEVKPESPRVASLLVSGNEDSRLDIQDSEFQKKLELNLTKIYAKDKAQFVKEGNFKLDEDLIKSITSTPHSTRSNLSLDNMQSDEEATAASTAGRHEIEPIFLKTPEPNIGAQKHIKKFSDFTILQKMGEGAYGKVNLCLHKKERYIVVIKMIFKERILVDTWVRDRKLGTIPSEIQIMAALNKQPHENILRLLDFFEDDEYYYIETPVHGETGCVDLFDLIELKTNMTEFEAKLIFKQVVSGIKHLHEQGIVHRDIKDENVIVDSKGFVKLIDFGSAAYVKSGPFDVFVGTIDYAAPEVLGGEPYEGKPQDIWAIGILLYTIVFKENPFYNIDEIMEGTLKFSSGAEVSDACINLIKKILNKSAPKRPTIQEIYDDEWMHI